jgi:hypothetical protein
LWGLALFSHRSASVPRRLSPRMMTVGLVVGKSEPGHGLPPALSFHYRKHLNFRGSGYFRRPAHKNTEEIFVGH